jgi:DNA adenine methylase
MRYQGSKNRIAKSILAKIPRKPGQVWVEPFVGGCGMMRHVEGERIGADNNKYMIALWKAVQNGWLPPKELSREEYQAIKANPDRNPPELVAFAGTAASFGGKWFGGYSGNEPKPRNPQGYITGSWNGLLKYRDRLSGVTFLHTDYKSLIIPPNSLIYCDPPYLGTSGYKDNFNHNQFWLWAESQYDAGHDIYVSEFSAPAHWAPIHADIRNSSMDSALGKYKKAIDYLYTLKRSRK